MRKRIAILVLLILGTFVLWDTYFRIYPCDPSGSLRIMTPKEGAVRFRVKVTWTGYCNDAVIQIYHYGKLIYPRGNPHKESRSGTVLTLMPSSEPYEIKVWEPGTMKYDNVWVTVHLF
jgi:hypothetical protein